MRTNIDGSPDTPRSFAEDLLDDAVQFFVEDQRVSVAGRMSGSKLRNVSTTIAPDGA